MEFDEKKIAQRTKSVRRSVLDLAISTPGAHLGGSFSEIEIIISLYDYVLKPHDKFILSKGHASFPLYVMLREKGYNPKISPHPDLDEKNGIYATTGSLGHGFPIGVGMAMARKFKSEPGEIYVLMSDGECQEGTTWESALIASKYKLDNFHLIIDHNKIQATNYIENILPLDDLKNKFESFGFNAVYVDGHSIPDLVREISYRSDKKPRVIIADTIKGKGISFMENRPEWHAKKPSREQIQKALEELS